MENKKLIILLHEHNIINSKIDDFIGKQFTYITSLFSISAGLIFFALTNSNSDFFLITKLLPYVIIIFGTTFSYKFNRALILHGYRAYLEDKINDESESKEKLIFGARLVKKTLLFNNNGFAATNSIVLAILFISTVILCHSVSPQTLHTTKLEFTLPNGPHFWIQIVALLIGLGYFVRKNGKAFNIGYKFYKKA